MKPGWEKQIGAELRKPYMAELVCHIKKGKYFPEKGNVFKAFNCDFDDVRVVIVGQDPYHTPGYATGLAFAVPNDIFPKPPSLLNIFKEVEISTRTSLDFSKTDLLGWQKQGVMLLNTILTVSPEQPLSHKNIGWENFTDAALMALGQREKPLAFLLWGKQAQKIEARIKPHHLILKATHPSPLSANRGPIRDRFVGCAHFRKVNEWLEDRIAWENT